jgi:hypothetical protein
MVVFALARLPLKTEPESSVSVTLVVIRLVAVHWALLLSLKSAAFPVTYTTVALPALIPLIFRFR